MLRQLLAHIVIWGLLAGGASAQSVLRIDAAGVPLEDALGTVRAQANLELVYADRLVKGREASCTYEGANRARALECVLAGTGLRAERVRRRQYVIVEAPSADDPVDRVSLTGYVTDAETGERLPGANVYLPALEAGTAANRNGYFVVGSLPAGPYEVEISFVGYKTVDTTLQAGEPPPTVALSPRTYESEAVLVESGSTRVDGTDRLPGMTAVNLSRLGRLPSLTEPDLFRALQWTPGVRRTGAVSGGLSVRGGNPDQNLYLLDGAPVYHPWHAFSLISTFQTGTLTEANLYRGAFPAEYGGRLSSVLDAQMKDGSRAEPTATAGVGVLSGRFRIEAPVTPNTSFMVSGRRSYLDKLMGRTHAVTDEQGRRDTLRTGYYFYDASAKVAHRFNEEHRVTVSYYHGRDDLDLRLPFDLSLDFASWLEPADLFFEVGQNWENRIVSGRHQFLVDDDVFVTSTAYYSGYRAREASLVQPTTTALLASDYRVQLRDMGGTVDVDYHHSLAHELNGGVEVSHLRFESTLDSRLRRSANVVRNRQEESELNAVKVSGYLQDTWSPSARWSVQSGVRASYFSGGDHVRAVPRVSARYTVNPRWLVLRGSLGGTVQYLHRLRNRQSLAYDLVSSRWVPASDQVRPATGGQVGLGVRSHPRSGLTLRLDTYFRRTHDLLVPSDVFQEKDDIEGNGIEVGALLGQYTRGEERAAGMELSAVLGRGPWTARLGVGSGRTLIRAPGRVQSQTEWRPSDLDVPLSLRAALDWRGGAWHVSAATEWRSGRPISAPVARYRVGDPAEDDPVSYLYRPRVNNDRLAPYFRVDLTLGYSFQLLSADWSATLNLFNATNRSNEVSRTYEPEETGVDVSSQRGLPILPLLELEMRL